MATKTILREKSTPFYIFLDDEDVSATVESLNKSGNIAVELREAIDFERQLESFNFKNIDGVILDYRLDGNQAGGKARYKAPALAQELRNRMTEGQIPKNVPLILCSTDDRIKRLNTDETSNDLFDYRFLKDVDLNPSGVAFDLKVIAEGYKYITSCRGNISKIVGRNIEEIDDRVFAKFIDQPYPIHDPPASRDW